MVRDEEMKEWMKVLASEKLRPMTEEEYDDTFTDVNEDVVYGIFEGERLVATSCLLHDVRAYHVNPELEEVLKHLRTMRDTWKEVMRLTKNGTGASK